MNKYEKRSLLAYNRLAAGYDVSFEGRYTAAFKELLLKAVKIEPGSHVLDVAYGNGRLLRMFADRYCFSGYGTDLSDKMVEQAALLNPSMQFSAGSCEHAPFQDDLFDVVTVCAAYHHFPHVDRFAAEAFRLMKKGATLFIAEVYYPSFIRTICNPFVPLLMEGDVRFYSPEKIQRTLGKAGFLNMTSSIHDHIQIVSAIKP